MASMPSSPAANASTTSSSVDSLLENVDGAVADDALSTTSAASSLLSTTSVIDAMEFTTTTTQLDSTITTSSHVITRDTLVESWTTLSNDVWSTEKLRPIQIDALEMMVDPKICDFKMLLVGRTGIGKTHFFRMMGCIIGGIIVQISPLLALSADQLTKLSDAKQQDVYGSVEAHNVDELSPEIIANVISRIDEIEDGTNSTVFLICGVDVAVGSAKRKGMFTVSVP